MSKLSTLFNEWINTGSEAPEALASRYQGLTIPST